MAIFRSAEALSFINFHELQHSGNKRFNIKCNTNRNDNVSTCCVHR